MSTRSPSINNPPGLLWRTGRLCNFLAHSSSRYSVHSPFLYNLVENVIRNREMAADLKPVEKKRKQFRASRERIMKTDFGRGSGNREKSAYEVSVSHIARTSLMSRREALRLYHLAKYSGAGRILELGTSLGITTSYFALANPASRIATIEGCPELSRIAKSNLLELGIGNVEVMEGRFEDRLEEALSYLGGIDLLVIDGDHRKDAVLSNLQRCWPFLHNDSAVIIDDIHLDREMESAWEEIIARENIRVSLDLFYSGWLFFRKESSREHFRLRYL